MSRNRIRIHLPINLHKPGLCQENCKSFCTAENEESKYSANRPCNRNALNNPKYRTTKEINYLRIQRFKRLIRWFHFDSVRDVLHVLTVETFVPQSAAGFLWKRNLSIFFFDGRNNEPFFNGKI